MSLLLPLSSTYAKQSPWHSRGWLDILHINQDDKDKLLQNHPLFEVTSYVQAKDYFITPLLTSGKINLVAEWHANVTLLEQALNRLKQQTSPATAKDNYFCRFPYRSVWLLEQLGHSFSYAKIWSHCSHWIEGIEVFKQAKISVVFVDEQSSIIENMMGHIALRFQFSKQLSLDNRRMSDDWVLSYFTVLSSSNLLTQFNNALFGGGEGQMRLQPFEMLKQQYQQRERRTMWSFTLKLSNDEKFRLLLHMFELLNRTTEYSYLDYNCGTALIDLVQVINAEVARVYQQSREKKWYTPLEYVQALQQAGLLVAYQLIPTRKDELFISTYWKNKARQGNFQDEKNLLDRGRAILSKPASSQWEVAGFIRQFAKESNKVGIKGGFLAAGSRIDDNHWYDFEEYRLSMIDAQWLLYTQQQKTYFALQKLGIFGFDYRPISTPNQWLWNWGMDLALERFKHQFKQDNINVLSPKLSVSLGNSRQWHNWLMHAAVEWQYYWLRNQHDALKQHQFLAIPKLCLIRYFNHHNKLSLEWSYWLPIKEDYAHQRLAISYLHQYNITTSFVAQFKQRIYRNTAWQTGNFSEWLLAYRYYF